MSASFRGKDLVDRRLRRRQTEEYFQRLQNVKPHLDITPPREYHHLQLSVKKIQMQEERQAAIDRQNQVILTQLMKIKQSPARVDYWNKDWKPTNDRLKSFRERKQRVIQLENEKRTKRLKNIQPYYNTDDWEKDFQKHQYYLRLLDGGTVYEEYEVSDEDEEKDELPSVSPSPEAGKKAKTKREEEVKLPPINGKKKGKDGGKRKDEYPDYILIMDAEEIHRAIGENGKEKILQVLGRVSEKKKLDKLRQKYRELYDKDVMEDVKPCLDEQLQQLLDCLGPGAEEDATNLYEAMKGLGTDEDILIEILCTRTNAELKEIRSAYSRKYENSLEEDLKGDTGGKLETLFLELCKGHRDESTDVDKELAKTDAKKLSEAGVESWGTDEGTFIRIFTQRSRPQLAVTFPEYKKLTSKDIADSIKSEMDGDLQTAFLTLVRCVRDPTGFHSDELHKALEESDAKTVARIILNSKKAQLDELVATYKKSYMVDLPEDIDKKFSGDMKTLILAKFGRGKEKRKQQRQPPDKQEETNSKKEATKEKPKPKQEKAKSEKSKEEKDKKMKDEVAVQNEADDHQHKAIKDKKSPQKALASKDKPKVKPVAQTSKKPENPAAEANEENEVLDIEKDVEELHKAIEAGDKANIVNVLARHCDERPKLKTLKEKYKEKHDQELLESIKPKLDEDLQDPVECLLMNEAVYDAKSLYNSMKGLGTDEDTLIEILCARNNAELAEIREAYTTNYGTSLEEDIKGDTSGDFKDLLVKLAKGKRDESATKVDKGLAQKDAEALLQAGYLGTDENKFIEVFTQRSLPHLKVMFAEYKKVAKAEMDESIEDEMGHDLERGFLALVKFIKDPSKFYADKLRKALNDGDIDTPGRIILTSSKAELADIMAGYKKYHGQDLAKEADAKFGEHMKKLVTAKLKKANEELKEKEKATSDSNSKKAAGKQSIIRGRRGSTAASKKEAKSMKKQPSRKEQQKKIEEPDNRDFFEIRKAIDAGDKRKIKGIICRNLADKGRAKKLVDDYNARYGKELLAALDGKLEKELIEATAALSRSNAQYDARSLHHAMKGMGMKEVELIETFATRTNAEIAAIRQAYKKQYSKQLEQDIRDETSGDFETLLVELSKGQRDESTEVSDDLAHQDAETLLEAGIKKWGTDEEKFIEIFTTRSFPQLRAMLPEYKRWAKCEIEETIDSEMSGNLRDGLRSLVGCVRDQNKFLADKLYASFQGKSLLGSTRIILGLKESVLAEVGKIYNLTFKPKLVAEVEKKSNNEWKKVILAKLKDAESPKESAKDAAEKPNAQAQPSRKPSQVAGEETVAEEKPAKPADGQVEETGQKQDSDEKKEDKKKENRPKIGTKKIDYQGTLRPAENFDAADDAVKLKNAMKGLGTDEGAIIAILGARSRKQRQQIAEVFQKEYKKNLVDELKSELSGKFEEAIVALMSSPEMYDANALHEAMSGLGTNESVLVEILCTRSFEEIQAIRRTYKEVYDKDLIKEIKDETSGDLHTTFISLAERKRDTTVKVDEDLAYNDATHILEAGENKWRTEESVKILTTRSLTQLQATFEAYKHVAKTDIMDSVNDELTGDFHRVIEAIVRCTRNPPLFFAEVLEKAVGGRTVDCKAVTRVVVTRAEIDLANIKAEYARRTGQPLKVAIENCLKGDLKRILLQIVGE